MGVIMTIETEAFNKLMKRLEEIENKINLLKDSTPLEEKWYDNQDVCQILNISKRTLQHYRDSNILPYSQIGAKIYYKATDIQAHLDKHYTK